MHGYGGRGGFDGVQGTCAACLQNWRATPPDQHCERHGARRRSGRPERIDFRFGEIARTWHLQPQNLPTDVDLGGLEATVGYRPTPDSGTFSYASHAAVVAVDPEIGSVEILDYAIVEDGGKLVNPMIVDGQIYGGFAQGVGTALYEEMPFNSAGQPLASTFADYLLPGPTEVPAPRIDHMETLAPHTEFGVKGIGEGGADRQLPAAIANAVQTMPCGRWVWKCWCLRSQPVRILEARSREPTGSEM